MKVSVLMLLFTILIGVDDLAAQSSTQSLEIPLYSNDSNASKTGDIASDIEDDSIDVYDNKKPLFAPKKQNRFGVYGILYGEPEKIELSTVDADDVGIGIGVEFNF